MNRIHAGEQHAPVEEEDLDALIAAAERRVVETDARVLRHGALLKRRLASHGTQARLGAIGLAGVAAILLLSRLRQRTAVAHEPEGHPHAARADRPRPAWWVQWVPVLLQVATAGALGPSRPRGMVGWLSALLSAQRRWFDQRPERQRDAAEAEHRLRSPRGP